MHKKCGKSNANAWPITNHLFHKLTPAKRSKEGTPLLQVPPQSSQGTAANVKPQFNERQMPCLDECHKCTACITILTSKGQHRCQSNTILVYVKENGALHHICEAVWL